MMNYLFYRETKILKVIVSNSLSYEIEKSIDKSKQQYPKLSIASIYLILTYLLTLYNIRIAIHLLIFLYIGC